MLYTDFCTEFDRSVQRQDVPSAYRALMQELGRILVRDKQDFVDLLNESGYEAELTDSDIDLVNTFVENVPYSPSLMLGASMLTAAHNRKMGFDGEDEYLNNDLVKSGYSVMVSYFSGSNGYSNATGPIGASTLGGAATGGLAGTIAGAVGDIAKATSTISQGQQRKKYGAQDIVAQKEASKQQLIQGVLQAKQQQAEAAKKQQEEKSKSRRTLYIVGGSILGLAVIGVIIYAIKKRSK